MAAAKATIKPIYHTKVVAYNKSSLPLGKRNDIDDLAILALQSGDRSLLRLFDELPDLGVLKKTKTDKELKRIVSPAATGNKKK